MCCHHPRKILSCPNREAITSLFFYLCFSPEIRFVYSRTPYKWNHIVCNLLRIFFFPLSIRPLCLWHIVTCSNSSFFFVTEWYSMVWMYHSLLQYSATKRHLSCFQFRLLQTKLLGIPGWRSGLVPAFGPGRDPRDTESNPTSGSRCMEPASPSAYVSASLSL